jgi:hypothetical protein
VSKRVTLYDRGRKECLQALFELPENVRLPKSAIVELTTLAWVRGYTAAALHEPAQEESANGPG